MPSFFLKSAGDLLLKPNSTISYWLESGRSQDTYGYQQKHTKTCPTEVVDDDHVVMKVAFFLGGCFRIFALKKTWEFSYFWMVGLKTSH